MPTLMLKCWWKSTWRVRSIRAMWLLRIGRWLLRMSGFRIRGSRMHLCTTLKRLGLYKTCYGHGMMLGVMITCAIVSWLKICQSTKGSIFPRSSCSCGSICISRRRIRGSLKMKKELRLLLEIKLFIHCTFKSLYPNLFYIIYILEVTKELLNERYWITLLWIKVLYFLWVADTNLGRISG